MKYCDYSAKEVLRRLVSNYVRPYQSMIFISVVLMIVVAAANAAIVTQVKPVVDEILMTRNRDMLLIVPLITLGMFAIKGIAEFFQNFMIKYVGQMVLTDIQMEMYYHLLNIDLDFIQSQSSGRLISRFTNDISLMRGAASNLLVGCAKHLLSVFFLIIVMFRIQPYLSFVVFVVFPAAIYPIQLLGRKIRSVAGKTQEELGHYTAKLDETFNAIKIVKSFSAEKTEASRARIIADNILSLYKKTAGFDALVSPIMEILSGMAVGFIIWYGGEQVISGKTTPGELFTFITAFLSAYRPFKSLVALNVNLQEGIAAAKRVFTILDLEPQIKNTKLAKDIKLEKPDINFIDVSLKFGSKTAVNNINLYIQAGKTTAIVGRSGSGKTSISNLIVRFYDTEDGKIHIEGNDIKSFNIDSLRKQISLVTQDILLFDSTVAENIAYNNPKVQKADIIKAAKAANAHEFIEKLPAGYDTIIGNRGATLSGGQRQRLSIARAFLKDTPIMILDEATSSLDLSSEASILESIKSLRQDKTTIIVTHRLASIRYADHIIVMKSGKVVEQGTHEVLIANKAEYFKLYHKQLEEDK